MVRRRYDRRVRRKRGVECGVGESDDAFATNESISRSIGGSGRWSKLGSDLHIAASADCIVDPYKSLHSADSVYSIPTDMSLNPALAASVPYPEAFDPNNPVHIEIARAIILGEGDNFPSNIPRRFTGLASHVHIATVLAKEFLKTKTQSTTG